MDIYHTAFAVLIVIIILIIVSALLIEAHAGHSVDALTGKVVVVGDRGYTQARTNWNPFPAFFPKTIVFAQNTLDVVHAVDWARKNNVSFRLRSGRHGLTNWSLLNNGLVIDVSNMDQIHIDEEKGTVTVGPGVTVGDMDEALLAKGYILPFGDSGAVGVGGITLGGGISVISRTFGTISDSLVGLEMVVAEGVDSARVVVTNEKHHADLLWASKGGGGNNFGVATKYVFRFHTAPEKAVYYRLTWHDWNVLDELIEQWQHLAPSAEHSFGSILNLFSRKNGTHACFGLYIGSEKKVRKILQPLLNIGSPTVLFKPSSFAAAAKEIFGGTTFEPTTHNYKFHSQWFNKLIPKQGIRTIRSFLKRGLTEHYEVWMLNWGGAVRDVSPKDTAFFWRSPKFYMEFDAVWDAEELTVPGLKWVEAFSDALAPYSVGSYVNVADGNIQDFGPAYYGTNFDRLKRVKAKYDPLNVFHYPQSIPVE